MQQVMQQNFLLFDHCLFYVVKQQLNYLNVLIDLKQQLSSVQMLINAMSV